MLSTTAPAPETKNDPAVKTAGQPASQDAAYGSTERQPGPDKTEVPRRGSAFRQAARYREDHGERGKVSQPTHQVQVELEPRSDQRQTLNT